MAAPGTTATGKARPAAGPAATQMNLLYRPRVGIVRESLGPRQAATGPPSDFLFDKVHTN